MADEAEGGAAAHGQTEAGAADDQEHACARRRQLADNREHRAHEHREGAGRIFSQHDDDELGAGVGVVADEAEGGAVAHGQERARARRSRLADGRDGRAHERRDDCLTAEHRARLVAAGVEHVDHDPSRAGAQRDANAEPGHRRGLVHERDARTGCREKVDDDEKGQCGPVVRPRRPGDQNALSRKTATLVLQSLSGTPREITDETTRPAGCQINSYQDRLRDDLSQKTATPGDPEILYSETTPRRASQKYKYQDSLLNNRPRRRAAVSRVSWNQRTKLGACVRTRPHICATSDVPCHGVRKGAHCAPRDLACLP